MKMQEISIPVKAPRNFIKKDLQIDSWEKLEPYFLDLQSREISSLAELKKWLHDKSELEAVVSEDAGWRYIKTTCDTTDSERKKAYEFFVEEIEPKIAPFQNSLNEKLMRIPFLDQMGKDHHVFLREVKKELEIFREENIPLFTEIEIKAHEYGEISGNMTIDIDGKELTMQQAQNLLKETDRELREHVFCKLQDRRAMEEQQLNELYSDLIKLRDRVAQNAGFLNFRDYKFVEMGRFDYKAEDCQEFHQSIAKEIVPIVGTIDSKRKEMLGLTRLKPWDMEVDPSGKAPLKPVENEKDLTIKTIACFGKIRPYYAQCIETMRAMGHLDLDSRKGKAPGGYNYPLFEVGVPFIFMNSVGSLRDLVTMVHEGGHAIHSFLTHNLELTAFKSAPSEVAELASMSMELISMEHWDVFFQNEEELKRSKREHLEKILKVLPWIAAIDKFQHWIYQNANHSLEERKDQWLTIMQMFGNEVVDWSGLEDVLGRSWQGQLHLFEVPFYYIEYGMAQLGAIAVWRNYKENPEKALDAYEDALKLGYTRPIREIYQAAGIQFGFSQSYIHDLVGFVKGEIASL